MVDERIQLRDNSGVLLELHFLPSLEYFACLLPHETVRLEACEKLPRRTYRNRCHVLAANGVDVLTVPLKESRRAAPIRDVKIDRSQAWVRRHWGCLQSAYAQSPYFEHYAQEFRVVYRQNHAYLFDFNKELLTLCLGLLGLEKKLTYTLSYETDVEEPIFDARSSISPRKYPNEGIFYKNAPYSQTFGNDFVPNLSIIDLLFNKGPESLLILRQSATTPQEARMNKA